MTGRCHPDLIYKKIRTGAQKKGEVIAVWRRLSFPINNLPPTSQTLSKKKQTAQQDPTQVSYFLDYSKTQKSQISHFQ